MTHEDAGHYSAKHPEGTVLQPGLAAAVKEQATDGHISCAAAHQIAKDKQVTPAKIGQTIDLLEYRIIKCQLGLFGYAPEKKVVKAAAETDISAELQAALDEQADAKGRIACADCWRIADGLSLPRMAVSAACETLGMKVTPCQLGAF